MLEKVSINIVGHTVTQEDCEMLSKFFRQLSILTRENRQLRSKLSEQEDLSRVRCYQISPNFVIVLDGLKTIGIKADGNTITIQHFEES